jgi:hypothetical protein
MRKRKQGSNVFHPATERAVSEFPSDETGADGLDDSGVKKQRLVGSDITGGEMAGCTSYRRRASGSGGGLDSR